MLNRKTAASRKCLGCFGIVAVILFWIQLSELEDRKSAIKKSYDGLSFEDRHATEKVFTVIEYNDTGIDGVDDIEYPIFQPNEAAEFPHIDGGPIRIPHVIHQICNTPEIPDVFVDAMKTFVDHNPTWQYRFWTYESGRRLLQNRHPYLLKSFDSFEKNDVRKSDMIRLAAIYEYGGMYADLDVKNLRSLNKTTTKYACILPPEPFEHSATIYEEHILFSNSILLCRDKHPFYKQLLSSLRRADPKGHPMVTTGPYFITNSFLKYNKIAQEVFAQTSHKKTNAPYVNTGTSIDEESADGIYIPNTQYFIDSVDPIRLNEDASELLVCLEGPLRKKNVLTQRACKEFQSRKKIRREKKFSFTQHYWFHLWVKRQDLIGRVNISSIIPTAIFYTD